MKSLFNRFVNNESGATAIEYGLIAALVAVALIAGAKMVGTELIPPSWRSGPSCRPPGSNTSFGHAPPR